MHEFEWYQSDLLKWTEKSFKSIEKWKKIIVHCTIFSKVSLHKKANSSRKVSQTYSEICSGRYS